MRVVLVRNSDILVNAYNNIDSKVSEELQREKEILSPSGEEHAKKIAKSFKGIDTIFSSNYVSALSTAKYIAKENNIKINISNNFNDRKIGILNDLDNHEFEYKSVHNFDFKLRNGESLNDVKKRASNELKSILNKNYNNVVIVTHENTIISILLNFCELGYNYDNNIILSYKDSVVCDTYIKTSDVYELVFEETNLKDLKKITIN